MSAAKIKSGLLRYRMRIFAGVAMLAAVVLVTMGAEAPKAAADNQYVGVDKCKTCHIAKEKGDQYHAWKETKHAKAFEVLATDKAKEFAKAAGVENPQTDAKCIVCHETGYGLPKEVFAKSFVDKQGVQCETCHGPGQKHVNARFAAAAQAPAAADEGFGEEGGGDGAAARAKVPDGEIFYPKDGDTCIQCHNNKSPSAAADAKFDFAEMTKKIPHKDPRPRPE